MKAIIFDMDGVLINTEHHHKVIERRIFEELGIAMTDEEHAPFIGMASDELWTAIVGKYQLDRSPHDLLELNNQRIIDYFSNNVELEPIHGVRVVLDWIETHQIPVAVASSSSSIVIEALLRQTNLDKYFDIRVGGQSVEKSKPEPYIYFHTAEILGVQPEECFVIEDSTNGITAAKSAGMYCIGYRGTGYHGQDQSGADEVISHFEELLPILEHTFGRT